MLAAEESVKNILEESAATILLKAFEDTGIKLAEQVGSQEIRLSIDVPAITTGMTADQVKQLMADETKRAADDARALAESAPNVKLLSDTIGAATTFDAETKKVLTDAVADLVTPEMSSEQILKLAQVQINQGNELATARQLSALGYAAAWQCAYQRAV
jgi:hypothetical protein